MLLQLPSFIEKNEDCFGWVDELALLNPVKEPESEFGGQIRLKSQAALSGGVTNNLNLLVRPLP